MTRWLRFSDLVARGVFGNRMALSRAIKNRGFPAGKLFGPNTRRWAEADVEAWIERLPEKQPTLAHPGANS